MGTMSVDVPDMEELLRCAPIAQYGDQMTEGCKTATTQTVTTISDSQQSTVRGGTLHLSAVLPAVSAAIGHPVPTAIHHNPTKLCNALGFPHVSSAIVVLIDGLGYWNLAMRLGHAPYLRSLMNETVNQRPIATCAPSTTSAAMAVFGTGTCPGLTGMAGYTQLNPHTGKLSQLIQFTDAIPPSDLQRQPTVFEQLRDQGVRVTSCGLPKFKNSPLTEAALRGSDYIGAVTPRDRVLATCKAAQTPGLTYLYIRDADKIGHGHGWDSEKWIATFERIDAQLALLKRSAPRGTLIIITADHGMIMADPEQRIDLAEEPLLQRGVRMVGGEPRAVMLYAEDAQETDLIAARWRDRLTDLATVRTRDEAIAQGLFGPVDTRIQPMLGDVIVTATHAVTIVDSRIQSDKATHLPSVHGSTSWLESDIPCLIDVA